MNPSELETACEDFSNIIDTVGPCIIYKGTLSSGVEIAVASTTVKSSRDWTNSMEMAYRKKVCCFCEQWNCSFALPIYLYILLLYSFFFFFFLTVSVLVIPQIDLLSRVNHKNFVNLIGFCEENSPFNRMMVFEYAPNGNLFEHLHGKFSFHCIL